MPDEMVGRDRAEDRVVFFLSPDGAIE